MCDYFCEVTGVWGGLVVVFVHILGVPSWQSVGLLTAWGERMALLSILPTPTIGCTVESGSLIFFFKFLF